MAAQWQGCQYAAYSISICRCRCVYICPPVGHQSCASHTSYQSAAMPSGGRACVYYNQVSKHWVGVGLGEWFSAAAAAAAPAAAPILSAIRDNGDRIRSLLPRLVLLLVLALLLVLLCLLGGLREPRRVHFTLS